MQKDRSKKIKKLIIPSEGNEKGLVAFGGKSGKDIKLIFKILKKGVNEHFTMKMRENGSLDFHKTKEGKCKSHTSLVKGVVNYKKIMEDVIEVLLSCLKNPIDINDPAYQDYIVLIPKSLEAVAEFYNRFYIKGERMIFPDKKTSKEIAKSIMNYFIIKYLPEIGKEHFPYAFVVNLEEEDLKYLIRVNNAYFLIEIKEKEFDRIMEKSLRIELPKEKSKLYG
jgi:hypothetical protein